jgi:hypothetical protein
MRPELRQLANGFAYKVRSFTYYDVNVYRFHTSTYDQSRPNRKTTNTRVLLAVKMGSSIMEDLKKYMNLAFMVANILILSYSNAIGSILQLQDGLGIVLG